MLVGEAFLDVTPDTRRQFVVSLGSMDVVVHGTRFSVSSFPEENEDEVALIEGSVEMRFSNEVGSIFLSPGELVKYDRSTCMTERRKFAANYFEEVVNAGGLQFSNERLEDIVASLNRHFKVNIVIEDDSLNDERFFASFRTSSNSKPFSRKVVLILSMIFSCSTFRVTFFGSSASGINACCPLLVSKVGAISSGLAFISALVGGWFHGAIGGT